MSADGGPIGPLPPEDPLAGRRPPPPEERLVEAAERQAVALEKIEKHLAAIRESQLRQAVRA